MKSSQTILKGKIPRDCWAIISVTVLVAFLMLSFNSWLIRSVCATTTHSVKRAGCSWLSIFYPPEIAKHPNAIDKSWLASWIEKEKAAAFFEGEVMNSAVTGEPLPDALGQGKNHNRQASVYAYPTVEVRAAMRNESSLAGGRRMAFLTFDDGISTQSTPLLLDILKAEGVPATFFVLGKYCTEETKPLLERILKEGHALAYHSFTHSYKKMYPGRCGNTEAILEEYLQSRDRITELLGSEVDIRIWRYPGGHMSWRGLDEADQALQAYGVIWIDWNAMTGDAEGRRAPTTVEGQIQHVFNDWKIYGQPNVITILMHDDPNKELTRQSLPQLIAALRNEGFSFGILE